MHYQKVIKEIFSIWEGTEEIILLKLNSTLFRETMIKKKCNIFKLK